MRLRPEAAVITVYQDYLDDWDEEIDPVEAAKLAGRRLRQDRQQEINQLIAEHEAEATDYHLDVLLTERLEAKSYPAARVLRDGWNVPGKPTCRAGNRKGRGHAKAINRKSWQSIRTFHRP